MLGTQKDTIKKDTKQDSIEPIELRAEDLIRFNFAKKCNTTGWQNNCGLNCLTHFFAYKLEKGEIQAFMDQDADYIELLKTFQEYYKLPNQPTWDDIAALFRRYPAPTDREAIFAPVLRKHLSKILPLNANDLWNTTAVAAFNDLLHEGRVSDIAGPVYIPNKKKFDEIKAQYKEYMRQYSEVPVTQEEVLEAQQALLLHNPPVENPTYQELGSQVLLTRKNEIHDYVRALAYKFWVEEGVQNYAKYLSNLEMAQAISSDELSMLCRTLKIGLEIYTRDSIQRAKENMAVALETHGAQMSIGYDHDFLFRVYNTRPTLQERVNRKTADVNHWEFELPEDDDIVAAQVVTAHNQYYPGRLPRDFNKSKLSGDFKIYGSVRVNFAKILADVKTFMTTPQAVVPPPSTSAAALPQVTSAPSLPSPQPAPRKKLPAPPTPPRRELPKVPAKQNPPLILSGALKSPTAVAVDALVTIDQRYNEVVGRVARQNEASQPLLVQLSDSAEIIALLNRMTETCLKEIFEKISLGPTLETFTKFSELDKLRFLNSYAEKRCKQLQGKGKNAEAEEFKLKEKASPALSL